MPVPRISLTRAVSRPVSRRVSGGVTRVARLGVALAGSAALVACASSIAGTGTLDPAASPGPTDASAEPSAPGSPTATTAPSADATGGPTSFHLLRFDLPAGWRAEPTGGSACLNPSGAPAGSCALRIVDLNTGGAGNSTARPPDPQAPQGWWMGAGPPTCGPTPPVPVANSTLVTSSFVRMRNKTAAYGAWQVTCADASRNFSPRLWWLPNTRVALVEDHGGAGAVDTQIDQIVASVTVTSD